MEGGVRLLDVVSSRILKTPRFHIPIGEPIKVSENRYVLRIKKTAGKETEDLPLESLVLMIVSRAHNEREQTDSKP